MSLRDLLDNRREVVLTAFLARVRQTPLEAGRSSDSLLRDSLPELLDRLAAELDPRTSPERAPDEQAPAAIGGEHGQHRQALGFDLVELAREWAILRDVILELMIADGDVDLDDYRLLSRHLSSAAIEAVRQFVLASERTRLEGEGRHLGFLAHELRNQLLVASNGLAWYRRADLPDRERGLELVAESIDALHRALDRQLDVARLSAVRGGVELGHAPVAVPAMIGEVVRQASPAAALRKVTLTVDTPDGLEVAADPRLLRSALVNLVGNAIKFTAEGSRVTVRARSDEDQIVLEVEDSCGGLRRPAKELFQPFVQAGTDRTGTGLGLAIVRDAVEAHGGIVEVVDLPGAGCIFRVRLPREAAEAGEA